MDGELLHRVQAFACRTKSEHKKQVFLFPPAPEETCRLLLPSGYKIKTNCILNAQNGFQLHGPRAHEGYEITTAGRHDARHRFAKSFCHRDFHSPALHGFLLSKNSLKPNRLDPK